MTGDMFGRGNQFHSQVADFDPGELPYGYDRVGEMSRKEYPRK